MTLNKILKVFFLDSFFNIRHSISGKDSTSNTLYTLTSDKPLSLIKSVFELRVLCAIGLTPDLSGCDACAKNANEYYFDPVGGTVRCPECFSSGMGSAPQERSYLFLPSYVLRAMSFIIGADRKRIFAFSAENELLSELESVCEKYLLAQIGRGFDSLNFYKSL